VRWSTKRLMRVIQLGRAVTIRVYAIVTCASCNYFLSIYNSGFDRLHRHDPCFNPSPPWFGFHTA